MRRNIITLLFSLIVFSTTAQTTFSIDGIRYTTKTDSTVNVVSNSGLYTGDITIPSTVLYSGVSYQVVSIAERAFFDCVTLKSVTIPSSVTSIGGIAFFNCSHLASVTIPSSVTSIGSDAFIGCTSITSISIPSSITSIQTSTFSGCTALSSIYLPSSVTSIGSSAFLNCPGLTSVYCEMNTPPSITNDVFTNVNFDSCRLYVPISSLDAYKNAIGWSSFSNIIEYSPTGDSISTDSSNVDDEVIVDSLSFTLDGINYHITSENSVAVVSSEGTYAGDITIPATVLHSGVTYNVTSLDDLAFTDCGGLTSVNLPASVSKIGCNAFTHCTELTSVNIPTLVSSIQMHTFTQCSKLTSITFPSSITFLDGTALDFCTGLTSIYCQMKTPPSVGGDNAFWNVDRTNCIVYVPISSSDLYRNKLGWRTFSNIVEYTPTGDLISTDSSYVVNGENINIQVKTSGISSAQSVIAYQFNMNYDTTKIEYVGYSKDSTLSMNGTVNVNQSQKGFLQVGFISSEKISGIGTLLNLQFKAINVGETTPVISDFLLNTDTVSTISNGTVSIFTRYGDVDGNKVIQAYDAALVLQNSVGLDPIPTVDPIPWSSWRIAAADVDNNGSITANDAGLILQKSIGMISTFPAENTYSSMLRSASIAANPDVTITLSNNNLVFKSYGNIIGLNVTIYGAKGLLDRPMILNNDMISAVNRNDDTYSVGLATAISPEDGSTFMTVPVNNLSDVELRFELVINTTEKNVRMNVPTSTKSLINLGITVCSTSDRAIHVSNVLGKSITVFDAFGKKVFEKRDLQDSEIIQVNAPGLYLVSIDNQTTKIMVK